MFPLLLVDFFLTMQNPENEVIIGEICDYAERYQIKALLSEYLKRLILEKPADPVSFLQDQLKNKPFVPAAKEE